MFKLCSSGHQFSFIIPIIIIKYKYIDMIKLLSDEKKVFSSDNDQLLTTFAHFPPEMMSSFLVLIELPLIESYDSLMI